jgi:hypothetical protein
LPDSEFLVYIAGGMKAETLRRLIEATPFQPFSVNLADGRELKVPHRDFISHSPNYRMLTVWHEDDSCDLVDFMLVIGFHSPPPSNNQP